MIQGGKEEDVQDETEGQKGGKEEEDVRTTLSLRIGSKFQALEANIGHLRWKRIRCCPCSIAVVAGKKEEDMLGSIRPNPPKNDRQQ